MSTTKKLKKYSKMSDEALKKRMSKKSNFPRDPRDYPQGSSPKPIQKKKQSPPKKKSIKKEPKKGNCKGLFKKGVKVGIFLAKSGKLEKKKQKKENKKEPKKKIIKKKPKKKPFKKARTPTPPPQPQMPPLEPSTPSPVNRRWTLEKLRKLPPQARRGTANLSLVARSFGIRITRPNPPYTRKPKQVLIDEILRAQN